MTVTTPAAAVRYAQAANDLRRTRKIFRRDVDPPPRRRDDDATSNFVVGRGDHFWPRQLAPLSVKIPLALIWNVSVLPSVTETSAGVLSSNDMQINGLVTVPVGAEIVFTT